MKGHNLGTELHALLDNAGEHADLRNLADSLEQDGFAGPLLAHAAAELYNARDTKTAEFWRRLAGSIRKAGTV